MQKSETLDVQSLMKTIKQRIKERIERGEISEDEIKTVEEMELTIRPNMEDLLDEIKALSRSFESLLTPLNDLWTPHKPIPHPGLKGKIISLIQKLLSPLTRILFATQMEFNAQAVRSLNNLKVYLARIFDLATNQYYLSRIQENLNEVTETQRRMFNILVRTMDQHRHLRRDVKSIRERSLMESTKGILVTPVSSPSSMPDDESNRIDETLYLAFEDLHRGNREQIKERQRGYLPHFKSCKRVLDVGCGRGEFLELLRDSGIEGIGIDINTAMVQYCQNLGLNTLEGDAIAHLTDIPEDHYDGIFCAQVVEHLTWPQILSLLRLAHQKLGSRGKLLLETINPQCLTTFSGTFYLDPTHVKPIHPLTLQFVCKAIGFETAEILYTSSIPDEMKLREVDFFRRTGDISDKLINVLNDNFMQLNELLYAPQDYAVLAIKGEAPSS